MRIFLGLIIVATLGGCVAGSAIDERESASQNSGELRTREEIVDQAAYNIMLLQAAPSYVRSFEISPHIETYMRRIFSACHAEHVIHWGNFDDAPNYRDHTPDAFFRDDGPREQDSWWRIVHNARRPAHFRLLNHCFNRMMDGFKQTIRHEYVAQGRTLAAAEEHILGALLAGSTPTVRVLGRFSGSTSDDYRSEITREAMTLPEDVVDDSALEFQHRVEELNRQQEILAFESIEATAGAFTGVLGLVSYVGFLIDAAPAGYEKVSLIGYGTTYNKAEIMGIVENAIRNTNIDWSRNDIEQWNGYVQNVALGDLEYQVDLAYRASQTAMSYPKDPSNAKDEDDAPLGSERDDNSPNTFQGYPEYGQQGGWAARSGLNPYQAPRAVYRVYPNGKGTNNHCGGACR